MTLETRKELDMPKEMLPKVRIYRVFIEGSYWLGVHRNEKLVCAFALPDYTWEEVEEWIARHPNLELS